MLVYGILCFLFIIINFTCIYFVRRSRTFAVYPAYLTVALILILGYQLTTMMLNTSPSEPPQVKNYKNAAGLKRYEKDKSNFIYQNRQVQVILAEHIKSIGFVIRLLVFQCFLALIAAVIGAKLMVHRRKYYSWICTLYVFLIVLSFAGNYLLTHRGT